MIKFPNSLIAQDLPHLPHAGQDAGAGDAGVPGRPGLGGSQEELQVRQGLGQPGQGSLAGSPGPSQEDEVRHWHEDEDVNTLNSFIISNCEHPPQDVEHYQTVSRYYSQKF